MPAPASSSSPARTATKASASKPSAQLVKKKRIVRRRGRAPGDITSDDEIEREAATDESDLEDDLSSLSSGSESDTEPVSEEVVPNGHSRAPIPNTSESPGDRGVHDKPAEQAESFFAASTTWSEMVADDEKATESGDLPVIEFADFDGQDVPARSRPKKVKKPAKTARPVPEAPAPAPQVNGDHAPNEAEHSQHVASSSRSRSSDHPKRLPGQTARQAYQQRLESDPSYVPTVGGFWSHDDRLLDKDLRSLSGWWRDRRGGRGRGNGFRGRGRGGFYGGYVGDEHGGDGNEIDLPPIERTWGHDGFEEMKKREEQRKAAQAQAQASFRGRGFVPGRGGRRGFGRGGYVNSPGRSSASSGRIWFAQKPDKMWTKQHEGYLYFATDPALRPTSGQGQGIHVKLPGGTEAKVVRIPFRPRPSIKPVTTDADKEVKMYTVNLPESLKEVNVATSTKETPIEEVFTVRPSLAPKVQELVPPKQLASPAETVPPSPAQPITHHSPPDPLITTSLRSEPEASVRLQLEQISVEPESSDPARAAKTEEAVLRNPLTESQEEERPAPSSEESISALPTMYSPPLPQPSPSYPSPYGYAPTLPPGIAMNQHGVPYELATGRPVYLQAAPPPIYNPRPVMHSHLPPAFVPTHMPTHSHSHSLSAVSPDFLAHSAPHTPPMNGFIDPSTGTPIFSFPRQTSRIEIRAPDASSEVKPHIKTPAHPSSGLRMSAVAFEPSRSLSDSSANGYYPTLNSPENGLLPSYAPVEGSEGMVDGTQHDPAMMAYAPYPQQQYYYPETYGYAYNPYMDMQHVQPYDGTFFFLFHELACAVFQTILIQTKSICTTPLDFFPFALRYS
ncbi:hypothetical protein C0995_014873 [Termitomyces sp. Mi166|nr:hypothetical protein C0995_014873 [Termitomyces sp. Mi166\